MRTRKLCLGAQVIAVNHLWPLTQCERTMRTQYGMETQSSINGNITAQWMEVTLCVICAAIAMICVQNN